MSTTPGPIISRWASFQDTIKNATAIRLGIDNTPEPDTIRAMKITCMTIYDPLCDYFGRSIPITSFYRSITLNRQIGGSATSQHCKGEAIDLDADGVPDRRITNVAVFNFIRTRLDFDQLIWEFGTEAKPDWVHVSYAAGKNRHQVLRATRQGKKTIYTPY
jgi:hypothetical protein